MTHMGLCQKIEKYDIYPGHKLMPNYNENKK